jgi:site-specific recombinase XerD
MDSRAITPASNTNLAPGAVPLVNWREAPDTDVPDRLSPSTVNLKLIGLRQFLRFCMVTGIARATVEKPYRVLNEGERRRLLAAARKRGPREYALITLALGTGLRVSELVHVRVGHFSQDEAGNWWLLVKSGKGRKDRSVPLAPSVMGAVLAWMKASGCDLRRRADHEVFLFSTRQSERMTLERARQLVKALAREASIQKPTSPHGLRHSMAIESLRAGASPVVIQKLLGHASLAPTTRYLDHLEREDLVQWAFSPE